MFKDFFNQSKNLLIAVAIISLVVGGLAGATAGILISSWLPAETKTLIKEQIVKSVKPEDSKVAQLLEEESATISVVKNILPAVVSIVVTKELVEYYQMTGPDVFPFDDEFFKEFFPFEIQIPQQKGEVKEKREKREVGGGTGFIISADGLIVTNKHVVVDSKAEYSVITNDNKRYDAKVLGQDPFLDVAVLKIEAKDLPVVQFGDSDKLQIGQTVIAIGNTLSQYRNTVTKGVVSGIGRQVTASGGAGFVETIEGAIQTDAAINPGNSGGPLVNLAGQVVGINTAVSREGQLIGFALPINSVKQVIESVKKYGKIVRPWLGVRYILITPELAKKNQLSVDYGALIVRGEQRDELAIVPGSPADKAGLEENDIILEAKGEKVNSDNPLAKIISKHEPGDILNLKVISKGETKNIPVTLAEFPQ